MTSLHNRIRALESRAARLRYLPPLILRESQNEAAERESFRREHGADPERIIRILVVRPAAA